MQIFVNDKLVANLNNKKGVWLVYNDEIQYFSGVGLTLSLKY